jgi:DNA-binding transcriptional MerR regulator
MPAAMATSAKPPGLSNQVSRAPKSSTAFRTISEVAEELDVAQHVLRFWESKFAQVRPLKRGGGRRYYRPEDVELLRQIRSLLYDEGYTIKGAQKLLRARRTRAASGDDGEVAIEDGHETTGQVTLEVGMPSPRAPAVEARPGLAPVIDELVKLRDILRRAAR